MLNVYQVCYCVSRCVKMGVVLIKYRSEVKVNGQYCWDILLPQQMLDAIIASFITIVFQQDNAPTASCMQHSPTAAVQNSRLHFL